MLKSDFHIHTKEDPYDSYIKYSAKDLIKYAVKLGFEVLSITNHHKIHYNKGLADYALKKGILLIPGVETHVDGKEVLLLNVRKPGTLDNFSDLEKLRNENAAVIAPHPFYPMPSCLGRKLVKNIQFFDGVEYSHFYLKHFNLFNNKAVKIADKYKKTLVGTSDAHRLLQFNFTYSLVDCDKKIDSVLEAIRKGKVQIKTKKLPFMSFSKVFCSFFLIGTNRRAKNIKFDNYYD